MPDLQTKSKTMEEQQLDPITDIGMVTRKEAPSLYTVVAQTTDGYDADLWKDRIFKSKVTRYLCFTRASFAENTQSGNFLVDMKLTDLKDTLPEGFTPIQETMDTNELALRRKMLCVKIAPRHSTDTAVCDVLIQSRELNGMAIWYLIGKVQQTDDATPSFRQNAPDNSQTPVSRKSSCPKRSTVRPDIEYQYSNSTTAIDDVPFMISERFAPKIRDTQSVNLMGITIKSPPEIEEEFAYSFTVEHSAAAYS